MDYYKFNKILNGNFENIPTKKSKSVRIFLSSTFSDTHTERDYLIQHVYPKLKAYCKNTYGLDFQILDMRWGISHEVTNRHMATTTCLNEIKQCQKYSVGPNFIVLLSHRYGTRCLPTRIIAKEYEIIRNEINASKSYNETELSFTYEHPLDKQIISHENLFEHCYVLDENEIPARYKLKEIDRLIPSYNDKNPEYNNIWSEIETKLGNILRKFAVICYKNGKLTETEYKRYFVSVTEKEIYNGIINAKQTDKNVLYFIREIEDIEQSLEKNIRLAKRFIDTDNSDKIDESAKELLNDLKYNKIPSKLPQSNIFKFNVKWDNKYGISLESHSGYIKKFAETFYDQVKKLIDKNQSVKAEFSDLNKEDYALIQEVLDHAYFCNETAQKFHGRQDLLLEIEKYLLKNSETPLVIHGDSGCGKTAILAKITTQILKIVPDPENYSIILRFLGTTPLSSSISHVYRSLINQITRMYNLRQPDWLLRTNVELANYLQMQFMEIERLYPYKKLVIILDSIDQLTPSDYSLDWFITKFPKNIKMIFSTLPTHGGILNKIKTENMTTDFVEIKSLNKELCVTILKDWLNKQNRNISKTQWDILDNMLSEAVLYPLYIKLIFDIIVKWTSFYVPDNKFIECKVIDRCIQYLFLEMEIFHGKLLFSRAIIYMSSFRNGISESEIEDILSIDDEVLYDIFEFHAPPLRKLPVALWLRIKDDLKGYMVEKEINDTRVLYWYHRRFIEVASSHYISKLSSKDRENVFGNVIDFFNETWKHTPKPYKYNEYIAQKKKLADTNAQEIRETTLQPTSYFDENGKKKYNQRKITELPAFIGQLSASLSAKLFSDYIFFNYEFFSGMLHCLTISEIFEFLQNITSSTSYNLSEETKQVVNELKYFQFIMLQNGILMSDFPSSGVSQIVSKFLNYYGFSKNFTKLIDEYDKNSMTECSLIVPYQFMYPPGSDLLFQLEKHILPILASAIGGDNDSYLFTLSDKLNLFNMQSLKIMGEIQIKPTSKAYTKLIIYFKDETIEEESNIKNLPGGFIVGNENNIISYSLDSTIYFHRIFEDELIIDLFLITANHLIVSFQNKPYVKVFNIYTSELAITEKFTDTVANIYCNTYQSLINDVRNFKENAVLICVLFNSMNIRIFKVKSTNEENKNLTDKNSNEVILEPLLEIPNPGFKITSLQFLGNSSIYSFKSEFILFSINDGSLAIVNEKDSSIRYIKPLFNPHKQIKIKILRTQSVNSNTLILCLGSNKHLYFVMLDEMKFKFIEIPGNFDNGYIVTSKKIVCCNKGIFYIYLINIDKNQYQIIDAGQVNAHYDDITFAFVKDTMLLTASIDSTVKVFLIQNQKNLSVEKLKFDETEEDILNLCCLNENHVISVDKANLLCIWNVTNGKIIDKIKLDSNETVLECITGDFILIVTKTIKDDSTAFELKLRKYSFKFQNEDSIKITEEYKENFQVEKNFKLITNKIHKDYFHLLIENSNHFGLNTTINYFEIIMSNVKQINSLTNLKPNCSINCEVFTKKTDSLLENATVTTTYNQSFLVIFFNSILNYFDLKSSKLIFAKDLSQHDLNNEYFLSPTNLITNKLNYLTPIENSHNLIALNNSSELVLMIFDSKNLNKPFRQIKSGIFNDELRFVSFKLSKNHLIAFNKIISKLFIFNLNNVLKANSFGKPEFELLTKNDLKLYGFSNSVENIYTVESKKILKFYNCPKNRIMAEIPLYSETNCIVFSKDFIVLAMKDKRIISYLICDDDFEKSYKKIKKLKSRIIKTDVEAQKKLQDSVKYISDIMDQSSDEDDDESLFLLKDIERKKCIPCFGKKISIPKLENNWLNNIFKKNPKFANLIADMNINLAKDSDNGSKSLVEFSKDSPLTIEDENLKKEIKNLLVVNSAKKKNSQVATVACTIQ